MGPEGLTDAAAWLTHPRDESTHVAGACQHGRMGWLAWVVGVAVVGGLLVVADRLVASGRLDIHYAGDDAPPFDLESGTVVLRPRARPGDEDDASHVAPHPD